MTKAQKIWMWIFIAMFVVPEILWSPVLNFYYEFWQSGWSGNVHPFRDNFLQNSNNWNYLKFVIFFQLIGLILLLVYLVKNRKSIKLISYLFSLILSIAITILVALALFLAMATNMRIF